MSHTHAHCRAIRHLVMADGPRLRAHDRDVKAMRHCDGFRGLRKMCTRMRHCVFRLRAGRGLTREQYHATFWPI